MRILIAHNRYRSGQPSGENAVVEDEARLLQEFGHEVVRLETTSDDIADWPLRRKALIPFRVIWSRDGYRLTQRAIQRVGPDVVHFHNTFPLLSPSALWAAQRSGVPVVQTLHNFRPICPAGNFLRDGRVSEECLGRFPWAAIRHGCYRDSRVASVPVALMSGLHGSLNTWTRCVDTFLAPSEFAGRKYVEAGWPQARIVIKFNTAPEPLVRRSGAGAGFVCITRLGREKGVDVLLDAWARTFGDRSERLTIIGSGDSEEALRQAASSLRNVDFVGRLDRAKALRVAARARAVIVPSRSYEVFPRAVVESYSIGVPVVAARIGALAEVVEDGRTGLLFSSSDEFTEALRNMASSPELSVRLGVGARAAYEQKYSPGRTTEHLLSIYRDAAARKDRAA